MLFKKRTSYLTTAYALFAAIALTVSMPVHANKKDNFKIDSCEDNVEGVDFCSERYREALKEEVNFNHYYILKVLKTINENDFKELVTVDTEQDAVISLELDSDSNWTSDWNSGL